MLEQLMEMLEQQNGQKAGDQLTEHLASMNLPIDQQVVAVAHLATQLALNMTVRQDLAEMTGYVVDDTNVAADCIGKAVTGLISESLEKPELRAEIRSLALRHAHMWLKADAEDKCECESCQRKRDHYDAVTPVLNECASGRKTVS